MVTSGTPGKRRRERQMVSSIAIGYVFGHGQVINCPLRSKKLMRSGVMTSIYKGSGPTLYIIGYAALWCIAILTPVKMRGLLGLLGIIILQNVIIYFNNVFPCIIDMKCLNSSLSHASSPIHTRPRGEAEFFGTQQHLGTSQMLQGVSTLRTPH